MLNAMEREIEELLRRYKENPPDKPDPTHPTSEEMMAVAMGTVAPDSEVALRVRAHCAEHPWDAAKLVFMEVLARNEDDEPPPLKGSLLELVALPDELRSQVPKRWNPKPQEPNS